MSHQPGCLKCELSLRDSLKQTYAIRAATHVPIWIRDFLRSAVMHGLWDGGSRNEFLVSMVQFEIENTGIIYTFGDGFGDPEAPFRASDGPVDRSTSPPLSKLCIVDAPIETSAFTLRRSCHHCGQRWSVITINNRMLFLTSFVAAHYLRDPGPIRPFLKILASTEIDAGEEVAKSKQWADDIIPVTAAVFVVSHEQ